MNQALEQVKMTKHPFKTYIGRIKSDGFDFLGYRIGDKASDGLAVAWKTWVNHRVKLKQLYEQGVCVADIAEYVRRWLIWLKSGVSIDLKQVLTRFVGWADDAELYGGVLGSAVFKASCGS